MFYTGSRYLDAGTYQVTKPDGTIVTVTRLPLPQPQPILGWHKRNDSERLDLLASHYLNDATAAWRLGWANGAMSLDALGTHKTVAIPPQVSTYQVIFDGTPADSAFYDGLTRVEVEENADLPDAVKLVFGVAEHEGDLTWVNDARVRPFANVAVTATPDDGATQTIFDGYVLAHKVHLETGVTAATLEAWGQDASVLMSLEDKAREFAGMTDGAVANQLFDEYGFTPALGNTTDDSPAHTEDAHTLMQRGTDIDFLRRLARRTGRWCRVTPERVGVFAAPDLTSTPAVTLDLNDPVAHTVQALDFHWDVARPTAVKASQASLTETDPVTADTTESGLPPLDAQTAAAFAGRTTTVMLTTTADAAELPGRAKGLLTDAGWLARCEGTADVSSLKAVLRVGTVVALQGVGSLLSGNYLVKSVRHTITADRHAMAFTLVRNALGPAA